MNVIDVHSAQSGRKTESKGQLSAPRIARAVF